MKQTILLLAALACAWQAATVKSAPATDGTAALAPGAYYKSAAGWVKLEQITMSGAGAKHMAKMFVPGLTPQMVLTFRGAEAPVEIPSAQPTFLVKISPYLDGVPGYGERDIVIVRFDKKKDHRELQTTHGGSAFTFKAGFGADRMPDITVWDVAEGTYSVTPKGPLEPGEYLITLGMTGYSGFDFGIKIPK